MNEQLRKEAVAMVCYGEVLWDCWPEAIKPGGAPMNVAYHLRKLGVDAAMISRVGKDEDGLKLKQLLLDWGFPVEHVGTDDEYPTSRVDLSVGEDNEVSYVIHEDVAWDYIPLTIANTEMVENAEVLVFGSLAARSEQSWQTLMSLIEVAKFRVMDINIRMPFFFIDKLEELLHQVDLLKLNKAELNQVVDALDGGVPLEEDIRVQYLQQRFDIPEVLLTKGSKGAIYYRGSERYFQSAFDIEVKDTVGSGDSFLAGFLVRRFDGLEHAPQEVIRFAAAVGAFNTTKEGACPEYTSQELEAFLSAR